MSPTINRSGEAEGTFRQSWGDKLDRDVLHTPS